MALKTAEGTANCITNELKKALQGNILGKISSLLKRNGTFVSDSPSEFNSRGLIHGSLWKLFDYPMTLSDVDIITPNKMENIFKKFGIQINKNCIGTLYSRAWGEND